MNGPKNEELYGKTLGIVGCGSIGLAVAERAKAFGMRIVAVNRTHRVPPAFIDRWLPLGALDQELSEFDYIVVAAALAPQTEKLIGGRQFALMKRSAVLVNVGRGAVIDEDALYEALKTRRVDGQENPLVITEVNKLYEVTRYVSTTNHMWSGFNLLANLKFWDGLPADVQEVVQRNVKKYVAMQRAYTDNLNRELKDKLAARGLIFNTADVATFRTKLGEGFYQRWKKAFGQTAWSLLEREVGKLG